MTGDEEEWRRLDPRMAAANLRWLAVPLVPAAVGALWKGGRFDPEFLITLAILTAVFVLVTIADVVRCRSTRYRLTPDRVELRSGVFVRRVRSVPRERVRSVDLTAHPWHRVLGLSVVRIGTGASTGSGEDSELVLDAVSHAEAALLRRELWERRPGVAGGPSGGAGPAGSAGWPTRSGGPAGETAPTTWRGDGLLAGWDHRWLRYAPLSIWSLAWVGVLVGAAERAFRIFGVELWQSDFIAEAWRTFRSVPLWLGIAAVLAVVVVIGSLGSLAVTAETWWGYRLEREPDGTLRVRRGLLTTRSVSLEERRLRGVEFVEPLFLRWGRGARVNAVAVGLGANSDDERSKSDALLPPAPKAEAQRVVVEVLREAHPPTTVPLRPHPRAALGRRLRWVVWWTVPPVLVLAVLGLWLTPVLLHLAWITAVIVIPVGVAAAVDAARSLGHAIHGRYLVIRSGTAQRRTVALRRDGVIGWTVSRSVFQRRAGLITLVATTAAGPGSYAVRDVELGTGLAYAEQAVPGLLAPFVETRGREVVGAGR
ncbi:PH domain-containing protein [Streptoalloteichus hindustanus]|uniref:Putative membrane protein n=1 Tax=Streptoalloteichus hindustanus TaxID=2017 RepID=A0A1M5N7T4_STRHI|nr:PH domain-containing protein [Streptoalloteichus hindustanus]SHG85537.1 putative membrane protein [Streptoalloteichus hindustanus]